MIFTLYYKILILKKPIDGITYQLGWATVEPLRNLFLYPDDWKKSSTVPIYKKENKSLIKNYRPISLLPVFGKVFERIIFNFLFNYFLENKLLLKVS